MDFEIFTVNVVIPTFNRLTHISVSTGFYVHVIWFVSFS